MVQGTQNASARLQPRSPRYDRLSPADCARLHDASVAILERTGVRLLEPEAVERLHAAGARVSDDGRVFVSGPLVEWALSVAPRTITLHVDVIDRLGPDGSFLEADHAIARYRERWYPTLIDRLGHSAWLARGGTTMGERAASRVDRILATHEPPPRGEDAARTIAGILERAERTPRAAPLP